jgi:hypothetical protein
VSPVEHISNSLDVLTSRLHESHDVSVYEAIERLVNAGESVGMDVPALIRMLDRGTPFEEVLELVEFQMERSQQQMESAARKQRAA